VDPYDVDRGHALQNEIHRRELALSWLGELATAGEQAQRSSSTAKAEEPPPENTMIAVATRKGVTLNEVNDKTGAGTEGGTGTGGQARTRSKERAAPRPKGGAGSDTQAGAAGTTRSPVPVEATTMA
jgi:hypothetical protein